ncbi:hypothetical protein [Oceanobacter mangrovi]|uniref:hypothetical protein n=1 Tax=Oceanobacter mangrovi TaxID=2862510 RepID=UPI001C8D32CB|nr:hypothetical protein [Oceanobacter mangrovi]
MPRIHRADLRGMTLQQLMDLLQAAADDGTYSRGDIEKVLAKIRKRILNGDANVVVDDDTVDDIVKTCGGMDMF